MRQTPLIRSILIFCIGVLTALGGGTLGASELDFLSAGTDLTSATAAFGACDGIGDGIWNGCRGTGCHVCQEKVSAYGCYFQRHTGCVVNTTCANQFYSCDAACPPPVEADKCGGTVCDGIGDGIWNGCRGTGCHVCQEKLAGYNCYIQNHPDCVLNTTCGNAFFSCDAACPPPTSADICNGCTADFCSSCHRPQAGLDGDADGVPDQLEYDLVHNFFPRIWLQGFDDDLEESYFYHGKAIPFLVQPLAPSGLCDEWMECLEIKIGLPYFSDTGDTIFGISGHRGDSEFYAVLVQRTAPWSTAQASLGSWQMIRDFTAAHWRASRGESSAFGAYGYCAPFCQGYNNNEQGCFDNRNYCSWFGGYCSGGAGGNYEPCSSHNDAAGCSFAGGSCVWIGSRCSPTTNLITCTNATPMTTFATLLASEGKHGLYHSKGACDSGGYLGADACPHNNYDLRAYKGQLLQNIGNSPSHLNFDNQIQHPDKCILYNVWGNEKFGSPDSSPYREHFNYPLAWPLP